MGKEYLFGYTPRRFRFGQGVFGNLGKALTRLRVYGVENVPLDGGLVLAFNHLSWIDPLLFGGTCPRRIYFLGKVEAFGVPGLGQLIRFFGTISVRRGESDREAVRLMREIARSDEALGVFIEGTRQRSGVPGEAKPGAAMVALQERVPVLPAAVRGTESWKLWNFHPAVVAFGRPMEFGGLAANGKGYREASAEIQREVHRLWSWLGDVQSQGRPRGLTVPAE